MAYIPPITARVRRQLADSPDVLAKVEAARKKQLDAEWPKPDPDEVLKAFDDLHTDFSKAHAEVNKQRDLRYQRDQPPEKLKRRLGKNQDRIYSRLSHNETMRVAAIATRSPPKFNVPAKAAGDPDRKRARKQSRWLNQLLPALWRRSGHNLWQDVADKAFGDGLAAFELFLTDSYDKLDTERRIEESDAQYNDRIEELLQGAKLPFGIRAVDRTALFYCEDESEGIIEAYVAERKRRRDAYREVKKKLGDDYDAWEKQSPGQRGVPYDAKSGEQSTDTECIRWYDGRWYIYWVDGKLVEGPVEHRIPIHPITLFPGLITGSSNLSERYQGVGWGTGSLEKALNDLLTLEVANALDYSRPKPAITSPPDARAIARRPNGEPAVLNLADPDAVPYLDPGQMPVDVFQNFVPKDTSRVQNAMMQLFQRSGMNPIASGEAPGADPAGYVVNSLQSASNTLYEPAINNLAMGAAVFGDKVRLLIRDTIQLPVYLSVPMADRKKGGTEWLSLGPNDIDETPCDVTIDPLSDVNRIALQQSLRQGNKEGYLSRERVQKVGYNIDDPEEEDEAIIADGLKQQLGGLAQQDAINQVITAQQTQQAMAAQQAQQAGQVPPGGAGTGAMPAPLNAPAVGAQGAAASQMPFTVQPGPAAQPPGGAAAGTGNNVPGVGAP